MIPHVLVKTNILACSRTLNSAERKTHVMEKRCFAAKLICGSMVMILLLSLCAFAEEAPSTRWADASDAIDKYLDAAFESYLDGDPKTAYDNVSNAYFRVYETTGFERQTMSYGFPPARRRSKKKTTFRRPSSLSEALCRSSKP